MTPHDLDDEDADVPEMAIRGLYEAHQRAIAAGHPVVIVQGHQLVRLEGDIVTVLKTLPERKKVTNRVKYRKP